ncbi:MAG: pentapeptide repeat-containing protein, partial [Actinomycetota bacterium]|nr:pentapeptide repeat-containing protein [Actinomycetota bacterium]
LEDTRLDDVVLDGARLTRCDLSEASAPRLSLRDAVVTGGEWLGVDAPSAVLDRARMERVLLHGATLAGASFRDAVLKGCKFNDADLDGADFTGATIEGCDFTGATSSTPQPWQPGPDG